MKSLMKDMLESERPYEKCLAHGAEQLSDVELLAVIIRTGTKGESSLQLARRVLTQQKQHGGISALMHLSIAQLREIKGIGKVKAIQLKCIAELSKRMARSSIQKGLYFCHPQTISDYFMEEMRHKEREELHLLLFNSKNKLLCRTVISSGTVNASLVSPREIFIEAMKYQAVSIILMHNHPSGDPSPSMEDISATRRIWDAGSLVGIPLSDHIIIGDNQYVSMKEQGIL